MVLTHLFYVVTVTSEVQVNITQWITSLYITHECIVIKINTFINVTYFYLSDGQGNICHICILHAVYICLNTNIDLLTFSCSASQSFMAMHM